MITRDSAKMITRDRQCKTITRDSAITTRDYAIMVLISALI